MNNKELYKKTLGFSTRRLLWDVLSFTGLALLTVGGFFLADKIWDKGLIGLVVGFGIGIIILVIISRYISYTYKAGQIAMMTKGITEDKLPDDVIGTGKKIVKERFATVTAYFAITGAIKGIFRQIGNGITALGQAVGGDAGGAVGGTVSSAIETVIAYLCDCCLGWVFYKKDEKATKATLDGAVIFFKHGKTLLKNLGRVFGMSIVSFIVIAGAIFGLSFLIMNCFPDTFAALSHEIIEAFARTGSQAPELLSNTVTLTLICAAIIGIFFWCVIHSAFVRPFILVGVLRNFIKSGQNEKITSAEYAELDKKSSKFKKLHQEQ